MDAYKRKIEHAMKQMPGTVKRALNKSADVVAQEMKANLSGRVLQVRSGKLRRAVEKEISLKPLRARVFIDGKQQYKAQSHEYGKTIFPKDGPFLVFRVGEKWVKTPRVRIPKRPFAAPALERKRAQVLKFIRRSVVAKLKRAG